MRRSLLIVALLGASIAVCVIFMPARAQAASPLAGVWTLNRSLSEFPREIGFNVLGLTPSRGDDQGAASTGGRGRRGSSGGGRVSAPPFASRPESYDDARRLQLLTAEVRNPPARLMIVDEPAAVTITNELGQSRTLHPTGKEDSIEVEAVPIGVTTKREADRLVVEYRVSPDRQLRYTYSSSANPARLVVDVQFLEHGAAGDKARRVYDAGVGTETAASPSGAAPPTSAPASAPPPAGAGQPAPEKFDQRPGAELRGLKTLGILVEDLSAQAKACGLDHDAIQSALSKRLTAAGFSVRPNSDDDTYVYVNVQTTSSSSGLCMSRYDAFLYSYATAKLSYRDQPVLVQVSLIHRGGIGSSAPSAHSAAIVRGLENYIDAFVTQIHDANK